MEAALARKGGCAPLGHLPWLWVNTPPGRPCSRCQAPKRDGTELWVFLGCPVPSWQHHPVQGQVRRGSPRVPLGQVGTRGVFQPSLPLLLSTFPFQRREEVENAQLCPGAEQCRGSGLSRAHRRLPWARRGCPTSSAALAALPPPPLAIHYGVPCHFILRKNWSEAARSFNPPFSWFMRHAQLLAGSGDPWAVFPQPALPPSFPAHPSLQPLQPLRRNF